MPKLNVVAGIIDKVADKIDDFTLDKAEKAQLIQEINKAQIEVNKVEAAHNSMFVAGWRPAIGWICALGMAGNFLVIPFVNMALELFDTGVEVPLIALSEMMPVLMGMLGLGAMRTFEKTKGVSREK